MDDKAPLSDIPDQDPEELKATAEKFIPQSIEEAVQYMYEQMLRAPTDYQERLKRMSEDQFTSENHHFGGQAMRNEWFLWWSPNHSYDGWPKDKPPIVADFNSIDIYHADDMSGIIWTTAYRRYKKRKEDIPGQVKRYKKHWKKEGFKGGIFKNE